MGDRRHLAEARPSAIGLVLMLSLTASLGGCSGADQASSLLAAGAGSIESASAGATPDNGPANPFVDSSSIQSGAREVIANPTIADVMKPVSDLPEMAIGRVDAPVVVIKYASMTCPYCRQFDMQAFPVLKREYIDTGKMRFIIREFPIGFQSGTATIALRCAPEAKRFELYHKLMAQQAAWVSQEVRPDPILKVASQVGMTRDQFDACRQNQSMIKGLKAIKDRGRTLGVIGTPNFFINGRLYKRVLTLHDVRSIVDPIIASGRGGGTPSDRS
jgi:protein-disulfide isomerase